ncbi:DUF2254 domain-containing protein [Desulfobulbus alkaliphilus]|uniref:DUF2254 domain-containing protein n=1 Tax=Desulfobulbus alkaliphilus TaxID=869814 RepID=UPI0019656E89|nr:DUF2254 domain-containing protein [Desulfobulbus alkaliphilus]MBM9535648.1 DUF2254 domain-containing protein [Desulfobulbus alkaliphilus]
MHRKLHLWWQDNRSSFWFLPAVMVLDAVALAIVLITVDATVDLPVVERWPLLLGASTDGARSLLTAVAGSMITVAGVVFSITLVALSLASSQYTSRVIRTFMNDRVTQTVLGVFVGIFAYCLVVLRTIREGDEGAFVPELAMLAGLILAFVGIAYLIYFIHHISVAIQASSVIAATANETIAAVDNRFAKELGDNDRDGIIWTSLADQFWSAIPAHKTGYIEAIDMEVLLSVARGHGIILRMEHGIGEFIIESAPLLSVADTRSMDDETTAGLNAAYSVSQQRTVATDAAFGIRQIVDIALKALSPGINDTTTAVMCIDYLTAILVRLATRRFAPSHCLEQGKLRIITRGPSFESLLADAFDQIRQNGVGNVAIMMRLLGALHTIAGQTVDPGRRRAVGDRMLWVAELAERTLGSPYDRKRFERELARVRETFKTVTKPVVHRTSVE